MKEVFPDYFELTNRLYLYIIIIITITINITLKKYIRNTGSRYIQEIGFTKSLLNWKTFTGPNFVQLPFFYGITQTSETVKVNLELNYLHLLKTNFNNYS